MAKGPEKGDKVSWNWGSGTPSGTVATKKTEGEIAIVSKRGNTIKKNASADNPAVHIERSGNDVVKRVSELNGEKKAAAGKSDSKKRERGGDEEEEESAEEKNENNDVKKGGKKQKTGPTKKEDEKEAKADLQEDGEDEDEEELEKNGDDEEHEDEKLEDKKETKGETKKAGPAKQGSGAGKPKKQKKDSTPRSTGDVSSRTRSRK